MIVDPTGTYLAIAKVRRGGWATKIEIFNKGSQNKVDEFDISVINEDIDFLNNVRFDANGKNLILGAGDQGIYSYTIDSNEITTIYPPYKYQFYDYDCENNTPVLIEYIKDEEDEYFLDIDLFTLKNESKTVVTLPLPLHYTRILTPTETHKYYGLFYEQDYDTYIAPIDNFNYQIIYRSKKSLYLLLERFQRNNYKSILMASQRLLPAPSIPEPWLL